MGDFLSLSLHDFRESLNKDPNDQKVKFMVKILRCLKYVNLHPEYIEIIGISWSKNANSFISNSKIIGEFLGIKSNTINTNYRSHGLISVDCSSSDISAEFGPLKDLNNWKRKKSKNYSLNKSTSENEVFQIQCIPTTKRTQQYYPFVNNTVYQPTIPQPLSSKIPEPALSFVKKDSYMKSITEYEFQSLKRTEEYGRSVAEGSVSDWKHVFGDDLYGDSFAMTLQICNKFHTNEECRSTLIENIRKLLDSCKNDSSQNQKLTYPQFLRFFMRYGSIDNAGKMIASLTDFCSNSFVSWFIPNFTEKNVNVLLNQLDNEQWFIIPSSRPGTFILYRKCEKEYNPIINMAYIFYDAVEHKKQFSMEQNVGDFIKTDSLLDMLNDKLGIKEERSAKFEMYNEEPHITPQLARFEGMKLNESEEQTGMDRTLNFDPSCDDCQRDLEHDYILDDLSFFLDDQP